MKTIKQFLEALIELVFLVITSTFAFIRWIWRKFKSWWKRRKTWAKAVIIFLLVICIYSGDIRYYHLRISNPYKEKLTAHTSVHEFYGGKSRLYDDVNERYLTPKYKWIASINDNEDYDDTLTVFCDKNDKRGYLNAYTGEVVIEPQYDAAWVFSDGLAAVKKDGMIGFVNDKNELVIPFKFEYSPRKYDDDYIDYVFHDGYCDMINEDGYHGIIDKTGEWVIEPNYYIIKRNWNTKGFCMTNKDYMEGYVNSELEMVFPAEYDDIVLCSDGYILTKDNRMWKEDLDGDVTVPFMYEYVSNFEYVIGCDKDGDYIYEISDKYKEYYVDGLYGIYDIKTDKAVTPAIYTDIDMIGKNMFSLELDDTGCFVFEP